MPSSSDNSYTKSKISKLKNGGHSPLYIIYNTNSLEEDAYNEEIQCIKFIKETFGNILTNLTDGSDSPPVRYGKDNHKSIPVFSTLLTETLYKNLKVLYKLQKV